MTTTYYSEDHEYVKVDGDIATIGITDYAQKALGDVVYAEPPKAGTKLQKGGQAGVVESVKSASEVYTPVSGEVTEGNAALADDPALVNQSPEDKAWFFKIRLSNPSELQGLKSKADYEAYIKGL